MKAKGAHPVQPGDVIIAQENPVLIAGRPVSYACLAVAGAILVIYVSNRIRNINVQNNYNPATTNLRVAVPSL